MRRWFAIQRDLGLQLFALYLLLIIPFLVTLLVFDGLIGVRIRNDVQASDLSLAQSIAQEVDLAITKALRHGGRTCPHTRAVIQADQAEWRKSST
jgi:hypothetical protein